MRLITLLSLAALVAVLGNGCARPKPRVMSGSRRVGQVDEAYSEFKNIAGWIKADTGGGGSIRSFDEYCEGWKDLPESGVYVVLEGPNPLLGYLPSVMRYGRVKCVPPGVPPDRVPLVWNLDTYTQRWQATGSDTEVLGKTAVIFANGDLRIMRPSDLEELLAKLARDYRDKIFLVLDQWDTDNSLVPWPRWRVLNSGPGRQGKH